MKKLLLLSVLVILTGCMGTQQGSRFEFHMYEGSTCGNITLSNEDGEKLSEQPKTVTTETAAEVPLVKQ